MSVNKLNLAMVLEQSARDYPQKTAVVFGETRMSYAKLNAVSNMIANALQAKGFGKGDKIALSCLNLPYFPMVYYAILKTGATVVPLNVLFKRREVAYHLKDSEAKAYFCFIGTEVLPMAQEGYAGFKEVDTCENFWIITPPGMQSPIEGVETLDMLMQGQSPAYSSVDTEPFDTAVILYTSGTTGQPKGAELSHYNIYLNAMECMGLFSATSNDVHLVTLPLFHSFGQTVQMNAGFFYGATLVLLPKFDPVEALKLFEKEGITFFAGVPTMYWAMLNTDVPGLDTEKITKSFRLGVSGGSAMPVEVMKKFEEKYKIPILEGYGLSETSPVASFSRMDLERVAGSIGVPLMGVEMKIVNGEGKELPPNEVGEIVIRGHNIMKGYYKKEEATKEAFKDGWFHSGDLGRCDEKGYFYIVDRLKDMIIRGGFNVYPREVEEVLITHPKISLAAVVGEKDDKYGEEVAAYVILQQGETMTPEEIIQWSKNEMAAYKYPRRVYIKDQLPMTATGKILKRELAKD